MRVTRKELAAAIRAARRYPPGFGMRWGFRGELFEFDNASIDSSIPMNLEGG